MTPTTIKTKIIETTPARTATIISISWRTADDPFNRKLIVAVNNLTTFQIVGDDYDVLGQWTDDTIQRLILARYKLELA